MGTSFEVYNTHLSTPCLADLMRTNIVLDDDLVEEAFALTGVRTKRELVKLALEELIWRRRKRDLTELAGRIQLRDDYDYKSLRRTRHGAR